VTGVAVLGSTGSIGRQALDVIGRLPGRFEVVALASGHADRRLTDQLARWPSARAWAPGPPPPGIGTGRWADGGLVELATDPAADIVVIATTGMAALPAVLAALAAGRRVALANKETLVAGGHLVAAALDGRDGERLDRLRPVDSEHSAIWQCLIGEPPGSVARLVLTASGGPFRDRSPAELARVTPAEALAHPTWRMGPKVTIDSATLVNKGFEAIEARWLFDVPYSRIDAVIHPQSVVHSLVEFVDGSYKAQLGLPDMRLPIQYALTHPDRAPSPAPRSAPGDWSALTFAPLEPGRFPAHDLVRGAAAAGGNRGTVLNAADEVAVTAFLGGRIGFDRIPALIAEALERWGDAREPSLDEITVLDREVRTTLSSAIGVA
jgi:1-deoxy-D-xylulose-5-phosphate reductoisomerase